MLGIPRGMSPVESVAVGDSLLWLHTTHRGYGFQEFIPVTVKSITEKRVRVEAPLQAGGTKVISVHQRSLFPKSGQNEAEQG